jgi:hypothetical protein
VRPTMAGSTTGVTLHVSGPRISVVMIAFSQVAIVSEHFLGEIEATSAGCSSRQRAHSSLVGDVRKKGSQEERR